MNSIKTAVAVSVFAVVMAGSANAAPSGSTAYDQYQDQVISTLTTDAMNTAMQSQVNTDSINNLQTQINTNASTSAGMATDEVNKRVAADNDLQNQINGINQQAKSGVFNGKDGIDGKDGTTGAQGAQGIAGANGSDGKDGINGKDGVTTTVTQLDAATQAKVAKNSQAITTTSGQAASVAQDLKDAKSFFSQQQASNNAQFKSLHDEVDSNKKEARSGAASAVAIASMPQVEAGQTVMFSAGVGSFKDEQAMSVGASFHAGVATVKAGISDSTNNDFAMGAGVGIGF
ncbi:YadA C-terminal domain-containing protein [Yokenella regensburgei]|uniref:YadA C-terminal domain-containing protein n=1 Tax=Yokenella regensburgei TaxID=158877 RepID=UPI0031DC6913